MNSIFNGFRTTLWFMLCIGMAISVLSFALSYSAYSKIRKSVSKDLNLPLFRIAK